MSAALSALAAGLWLAAVAWLRAYRIWLPYYILAVGGSAVAVALLGGRAGLDRLLAAQVARHVHLLGSALGLPTHTPASAPGTLLVLVVDQEIGWTALEIGVESSGLLELGVLTSILAWYPGLPGWARLRLLAAGLAATYLANLARVLLITAMLHHLGKSALVVAHTYLGKALFFGLVIAIIWRTLTLASVRSLARERAQ